jgi:hypothetical protein
LNTALSDLQYVPAPNFNSAPWASFSTLEPLGIEATDDMLLKCSWHRALVRAATASLQRQGCGEEGLQCDILNVTIRKANLTTRHSIPVFVLPVWKPPSLHYPHDLPIDFPEDTMFVLQDIQLDAGDYLPLSLVTVTTRAVHGRVQMIGVANEYLDNGCLQAQRLCSISGTIADVRMAIATVFVHPDPDFAGVLPVEVELALKQHRSRAEIELNVLPVNDPPVVTVAVMEWSVPTTQPQPLLGVHVTDIDSTDEPLLVRIACQAGRLEYAWTESSESHLPNSRLIQGTHEVQLYALPHLVGEVLAHVKYVAAELPGNDTVIITVIDADGAATGAAVRMHVFQPAGMLSLPTTTLQTREDTTIVLPVIGVQTAGVDLRGYRLIMECSACMLTSPVTMTRERVIMLQGTSKQLESQLAEIALLPLPDFFGKATLLASLTAAWDDAVVDRRRIDVLVQPVEDPMQIHLGMSGDEIHECVLLGNVSILDVDGHDTLSVSLRVRNGTLKVLDSATEVNIRHASSQRIDLQASAPTISMFTMYAVEYCPPAAYHGEDLLQVEVQRMQWTKVSEPTQQHHQQLHLSFTGAPAFAQRTILIASPSLAMLTCPPVLEIEEDSQPRLGSFLNVSLFASTLATQYEVLFLEVVILHLPTIDETSSKMTDVWSNVRATDGGHVDRGRVRSAGCCGGFSIHNLRTACRVVNFAWNDTSSGCAVHVNRRARLRAPTTTARLRRDRRNHCVQL